MRSVSIKWKIEYCYHASELFIKVNSLEQSLDTESVRSYPTKHT